MPQQKQKVLLDELFEYLVFTLFIRKALVLLVIDVIMNAITQNCFTESLNVAIRSVSMNTSNQGSLTSKPFITNKEVIQGGRLSLLLFVNARDEIGEG